jgi:hypothetical protein
LDEVLGLLGKPTVEGCRSWGYEPDLVLGPESVGLKVYFQRDGKVYSLLLENPMTLGQLVEAYGSPSRVFRVSHIGEDESGELGATRLFYDEPSMTVVIMQGLCEFPADVVVDQIQVIPPEVSLEDELPSSNAVETEWPGLAD